MVAVLRNQGALEHFSGIQDLGDGSVPCTQPLIARWFSLALAGGTMFLNLFLSIT